MLIVSLSVLGGEVVTYNITGVHLTSYTGQEVSGLVETIVDMDAFNEQTEEIITANYTANTTYYDRVETFTTGAAFAAWGLITLLSGTYIFNFLYLMGVPEFFVTILVVVYVALLGRAVMGYVRGI